MAFIDKLAAQNRPQPEDAQSAGLLSNVQAGNDYTQNRVAMELQISQKQKEQQAALDRASENIHNAMGKLKLPVDEENTQMVVSAMSKGRDVRPRGLLAERRKELLSRKEDILNEIRFDYEQDALGNKKKQLVRDKAGNIIGNKDVEDLRPKEKELGELKRSSRKARMQALDKQLAQISDVMLKLDVGSGLTNSEDFQDLMKSLITGQDIPTTLERFSAQTERKGKEADVEKGKREELFKGLELSQKDKELDQKYDLKIAELANNLQKETIKAEGKDAKLDKETAKKIKAKLIDMKTSFSDLTGIAQDFDKGLFTAGSKAKETLLNAADYAGFSLSDSSKKFIGKMQGMQTSIGMAFASYMKMMSGSAISEPEFRRMEKRYINPNMSPTQAQAALKELLSIAVRDQIIMADMLKNGVSIKDSAEWTIKRNELTTNSPEVMQKVKAIASNLFESSPEDRKAAARAALKARGMTDEQIDQAIGGQK